MSITITVRISEENRDDMRALAAKLKYPAGQAFSNDEALTVVLEKLKGYLNESTL